MGPQEDYIETILTCKGDYYDPEFHVHLENFSQKLEQLIVDDEKDQSIVIKKVEPWNSVRITFNIPREAAQRLKQMAEQGNEALKQLGVLGVQVEGDKLISLKLQGRNNETTELVFRTAGDDTAKVDLRASGSAAPPDGLANINQYMNKAGGGIFEQLFSVGAMATPAPTALSATSRLPFGAAGPPAAVSVAACRLGAPQPHSVRSPPVFASSGALPTVHSASPQSPKFPTPPPSAAAGPHSPRLLPPPAGPLMHQQPQGGAMYNMVRASAHHGVQMVAGQSKDVSNSSPLLVNLLQTDVASSLGNQVAVAAQQQGQMPAQLNHMVQSGHRAMVDALAPPAAKKRRRQRKVKGASPNGDPEQEYPPPMGLAANAGTAASNPALMGAQASTANSLPGVSFNRGHGMMEASSLAQLKANMAALAQSGVKISPDRIINPYTGQMEPMDSSADSVDSLEARELLERTRSAGMEPPLRLDASGGGELRPDLLMQHVSNHHGNHPLLNSSRDSSSPGASSAPPQQPLLTSQGESPSASSLPHHHAALAAQLSASPGTQRYPGPPQQQQHLLASRLQPPHMLPPHHQRLPGQHPMDPHLGPRRLHMEPRGMPQQRPYGPGCFPPAPFRHPRLPGERPLLRPQVTASAMADSSLQPPVALAASLPPGSAPPASSGVSLATAPGATAAAIATASSDSMVVSSASSLTSSASSVVSNSSTSASPVAATTASARVSSDPDLASSTLTNSASATSAESSWLPSSTAAVLTSSVASSPVSDVISSATSDSAADPVTSSASGAALPPLTSTRPTTVAAPAESAAQTVTSSAARPTISLPTVCELRESTQQRDSESPRSDASHASSVSSKDTGISDTDDSRIGDAEPALAGRINAGITEVQCRWSSDNPPTENAVHNNHVAADESVTKAAVPPPFSNHVNHDSGLNSPESTRGNNVHLSNDHERNHCNNAVPMEADGDTDSGPIKSQSHSVTTNSISNGPSQPPPHNCVTVGYALTNHVPSSVERLADCILQPKGRDLDLVSQLGKDGHLAKEFSSLADHRVAEEKLDALTKRLKTSGNDSGFNALSDNDSALAEQPPTQVPLNFCSPHVSGGEQGSEAAPSASAFATDDVSLDSCLELDLQRPLLTPLDDRAVFVGKKLGGPLPECSVDEVAQATRPRDVEFPSPNTDSPGSTRDPQGQGADGSLSPADTSGIELCPSSPGGGLEDGQSSTADTSGIGQSMTSSPNRSGLSSPPAVDSALVEDRLSDGSKDLAETTVHSDEEFPGAKTTADDVITADLAGNEPSLLHSEMDNQSVTSDLLLSKGVKVEISEGYSYGVESKTEAKELPFLSHSVTSFSNDAIPNKSVDDVTNADEDARTTDPIVTAAQSGVADSSNSVTTVAMATHSAPPPSPTRSSTASSPTVEVEAVPAAKQVTMLPSLEPASMDAATRHSAPSIIDLQKPHTTTTAGASHTSTSVEQKAVSPPMVTSSSPPEVRLEAPNDVIRPAFSASNQSATKDSESVIGKNSVIKPLTACDGQQDNAMETAVAMATNTPKSPQQQEKKELEPPRSHGDSQAALLETEPPPSTAPSPTVDSTVSVVTYVPPLAVSEVTSQRTSATKPIASTQSVSHTTAPLPSNVISATSLGLTTTSSSQACGDVAVTPSMSCTNIASLLKIDPKNVKNVAHRSFIQKSLATKPLVDASKFPTPLNLTESVQKVMKGIPSEVKPQDSQAATTCVTSSAAKCPTPAMLSPALTTPLTVSVSSPPAGTSGFVSPQQPRRPSPRVPTTAAASSTQPRRPRRPVDDVSAEAGTKRVAARKTRNISEILATRATLAANHVDATEPERAGLLESLAKKQIPEVRNNAAISGPAVVAQVSPSALTTKDLASATTSLRDILSPKLTPVASRTIPTNAVLTSQDQQLSVKNMGRLDNNKLNVETKLTNLFANNPNKVTAGSKMAPKVVSNATPKVIPNHVVRNQKVIPHAVAVDLMSSLGALTTSRFPGSFGRTAVATEPRAAQKVANITVMRAEVPFGGDGATRLVKPPPVAEEVVVASESGKPAAPLVNNKARVACVVAELKQGAEKVKNNPVIRHQQLLQHKKPANNIHHSALSNESRAKPAKMAPAARNVPKTTEKKLPVAAPPIAVVTPVATESKMAAEQPSPGTRSRRRRGSVNSEASESDAREGGATSGGRRGRASEDARSSASRSPAPPAAAPTAAATGQTAARPTRASKRRAPADARLAEPAAKVGKVTPSGSDGAVNHNNNSVAPVLGRGGRGRAKALRNATEAAEEGETKLNEVKVVKAKAAKSEPKRRTRIKNDEATTDAAKLVEAKAPSKRKR